MLKKFKEMKKVGLFSILTLLIFTLLSCSKGEKKIEKKFSNGEPEIVAYYKQNKKVYEEHFYENGKLRSEGDFNGKVRSGQWTFYFDDGKVFAKADFSKKKEGESWQIYKHEGDKLIGKSDKITAMSFSPEGTLVDITIKDPKDNKKEIYYRFFNSFKLRMQITLVGNMYQGQALSWHENGKINSEVFYVDGLEDSTYISYADNGQTMEKGQYKKGVKVGKWEHFNSEGKPLGVEIYDKDGTLLRETNTQGLRFSHRNNGKAE